MHTLYLTDAEAKKFASLPDAMKSGYAVEKEALTYEDSPERRAVRFELLKVSDPQVLRLREAIKTVRSDQEFLQVAGKFDVTKLNEADVARVLFALGPDALGLMIVDLLGKAKTGEKMELASSIAEARHALLESYAATSS